VLGIDPGLVNTGYGGLARGARGIEIVATGVIAAATRIPLEARLAQVYDGMIEVLDGFQPDMVVLEDLYTEYRFPRTAILMAHARGVICLAARQRNVAVVTLPPATVKRAIAASGAASKEQIQLAVQHLLGLDGPPRGPRTSPTRWPWPSRVSREPGVSRDRHPLRAAAPEAR
jgi:crossover junction endodeoxyribonuclease RuvC